MTKYIFWAGSIKGLLVDIELMAINYVEAKRKVLKYVILHTELKHPIRGVKPSGWEYFKE